MSAMYLVTFDNGQTIYINAADAKSMKRSALTAAYANARRRAEARLAKKGIKAKAISARCVG